MKRKLTRLSHVLIKGVVYLMWAGAAYQAAVYFVNTSRVDNYSAAVIYWQGIWKVLSQSSGA